MEKMNDLNDLLKHEIQDLCSAEDQIIAAMPTMIGKAKNPMLKRALEDHLAVTEKQRARLEQVQSLMSSGNAEEAPEKKGLLSRLFKGRQVCLGMKGLIEEGTKVMKEDMDPDVMDAAIIACAQKIEHYEICGYGTARTFARELNLAEVAALLEQTLNEEYSADDLLTRLATTGINQQAESGKAAARPATKSGTPRSGSVERTRREEPEMEMASASRGTAARKTAGAGGKSSPAPKGSSNRTVSGASRTAASTKRTAASSKSETKGSGRSSSNSRGTGSQRGR